MPLLCLLDNRLKSKFQQHKNLYFQCQRLPAPPAIRLFAVLFFPGHWYVCLGILILSEYLPTLTSVMLQLPYTLVDTCFT